MNGEPAAMEGSLPLGMIEGAEYSVMRFQLNENDKLLLLSGGIAEATDAEGHLFGFVRVHELLRTATTAAELATAAQSFGQEDDISVIYVTRNCGHGARDGMSAPGTNRGRAHHSLSYGLRCRNFAANFEDAATTLFSPPHCHSSRYRRFAFRER